MVLKLFLTIRESNREGHSDDHLQSSLLASPECQQVARRGVARGEKRGEQSHSATAGKELKIFRISTLFLQLAEGFPLHADRLLQSFGRLHECVRVKRLPAGRISAPSCSSFTFCLLNDCSKIVAVE